MDGVNEIVVDGVKYVPKSNQEVDCNEDGWRLCIIRTYSAGVWYGWVDYDAENNFLGVIVKKARRMWKWQNAFSLSELATKGASGDTRLAVALPEMKLNRVIELIPVSGEAEKVLNAIKDYEV